jgi:MFS transporter, PAT family, beta-lactamase induction signal transducer AmpG
MQQQPYTRPLYILFLTLPFGISNGFVTVTLPYLLTHDGFSVAATGAIVALGVSANIWRFIWGPVADLTLSLRKWYWIGNLAAVITLLILCMVPYNVKGTTLITVMVFISQVAATFVVMPVSSIMAHFIEPGKKGRASGWYQAGNLGGVGLGGGAGLWLATHFSIVVAGIVLSVACLATGLVVQLVHDLQPEDDSTILKQIVAVGKDLVQMVRVPIALFVMLLLLMPIGTGAAANLWSAIAGDWKTDVDTVALVTGVLSGITGTLGCVIGGYIADRVGVWVAYLGSGGVCAFVTILMAFLPLQPVEYIGGVLAYAFGLGLLNAAFSSVILYAIGKKNAATKYSLFSSLGNVPVVYMTTFDGWTHDLHNSRFMLVTEALLGIAFILVCIITIRWMIRRNWVPKVIE